MSDKAGNIRKALAHISEQADVEMRRSWRNFTDDKILEYFEFTVKRTRKEAN